LVVQVGKPRLPQSLYGRRFHHRHPPMVEL